MNLDQLPSHFLCRDPVFKAVFTKDSPESQGALKGLISAFIGEKVTSATVIANEPAAEDLRQRSIRYDISARLDSGELVNIEVMLNPKSTDKIRVEYFLARLHGNQHIKGADKNYNDLTRSWQLSIADDGNFFADTEWFHQFSYFDAERHVSLGGLTHILTLELEKLDKVLVKPVSQMSSLERWSVYFKYFTDPEKQGLLREILKHEEAIEMATQVVNTFSQSEIEFFRKMSEDKYEWDRQTAIYEAKQTGHEQGLAEGRAEGHAEGHAKGIAEGRAEGIAEGRAEGIAKGRAEGIAKGRIEGEAEVLNLLKKTGYDTSQLEKALKEQRLDSAD